MWSILQGDMICDVWEPCSWATYFLCRNYIQESALTHFTPLIILKSCQLVLYRKTALILLLVYKWGLSFEVCTVGNKISTECDWRNRRRRMFQQKLYEQKTEFFKKLKEKKKLAFCNQWNRFTELWRMAEISAILWSNPTVQSRVSYRRLLRTVYSRFLNISEIGDFTTSAQPAQVYNRP